MKFSKLLAIILCMSMLLMCFVGCNTNDEATTEDPENNTTNDTEPPVEDVGEFDYERRVASFVYNKSDAKGEQQINAYETLAAKFTVTSGYLEQISAFLFRIGDVKFSLYKWNGSYDNTIASEPIKQKVFLKSDLMVYQSNCYNMELTFEKDEVGAGTYLYLISAVEGSTNYASVWTGFPWPPKRLTEEYKTYELEFFYSGETVTDKVAQSGFTFQAKVDKKNEPETPFPAGNDPEGTAKVILLGGQSNAEGVSLVGALPSRVSAEKYAEYTNGYSNVQIMYGNVGGGIFSDSFVNTKAGQGTTPEFFGPELGIAEYLATNFPDEKFYIIKYAKGGSILDTEWYSAKTGTPLTLLEGFTSFVSNGLAQLEAQGLTPKIVGFVWNQGESDALWWDQAERYYANLSGMVDYVRTTFADYASAKGIGFMDASIHGAAWNAYMCVNNHKYNFSLTSPINFYIEIQKYDIKPLEDSQDIAHYGALSMLKLGNLYGAEIAKMLR